MIYPLELLPLLDQQGKLKTCSRLHERLNEYLNTNFGDFKAVSGQLFRFKIECG